MENQNKGLVDNLLFEVYKDKKLISSHNFKIDVNKNYGYSPSSDLYTRIVNYQIKKYGKQLTDNSRREYVKYFMEYGKTNREATKKRVNNHRQEIEYLEDYEQRRKNS